LNIGVMNGVAKSLLVVSLIGCAVACSEPKSDGFDELWVTEHVAYHARSRDTSVCEGVAATVDLYLSALAERMGVDARDLPILSYHKYDDENEVAEAEICGADATGCANAHGVWDVRPVNGHELVHWVLANRFDGTAPQLLEEGLATALSCEPYSDGFDAVVPDWGKLASNAFPLDQYVVAGQIVTAMIHEIGMDEVLRIYDALPDDDDLSLLNSAVQQRTGMTLEQLYAHAVEAAWPTCIPVYACSGARLDEGRTRLSLGCHGYDPAILPQRPGAFARLSATSNLVMRSCDLGTEPTPDRYRLMSSGEAFIGELLMELPESPVALTFSHAEDIERQAREAELTIAYAANAVKDGCSSLTPIRSFVNSGMGILLSPRAEYRTVAFAQNVSHSLQIDYLSAGASVEWCQTCADDVLLDCAQIAPMSSQTVTAPSTGYLRIRRESGEGDYMMVKVSEPTPQ
jgi:hypothetical protein